MQDLQRKLQLIHELSITDELVLPLHIFKDRRLGMLESTIVYLKDSKNLTFNQIAKELNRDNRTIWSAYHKAKKKLK